MSRRMVRAALIAVMAAASEAAAQVPPPPQLPPSPQRVCLSVDVLNGVMALAQENADLAQAKFLNARQRVLADAQWQTLAAAPAPVASTRPTERWPACGEVSLRRLD